MLSDSDSMSLTAELSYTLVSHTRGAEVIGDSGQIDTHIYEIQIQSSFLR